MRKPIEFLLIAIIIPAMMIVGIIFLAGLIPDPKTALHVKAFAISIIVGFITMIIYQFRKDYLEIFRVLLRLKPYTFQIIHKERAMNVTVYAWSLWKAGNKLLRKYKGCYIVDAHYTE